MSDVYTKCTKCNEVIQVSKFVATTGFKVYCRNCLNTYNRNKARTTNRVKPTTGFIYILTNAAWPDWVKIGVTSRSVEERLMDYQIGSPMRDYEMHSWFQVNDIYDFERVVFAYTDSMQIERGTEWIKLDKYAASSLIERLLVGKNHDNDL